MSLLEPLNKGFFNILNITYHLIYHFFCSCKKEDETAQQVETKLKAKYSDLIEFRQLLDMGIITQAEFDMKKNQILRL